VECQTVRQGPKIESKEQRETQIFQEGQEDEYQVILEKCGSQDQDAVGKVQGTIFYSAMKSLPRPCQYTMDNFDSK
jgi:hypothetical protein